MAIFVDTRLHPWNNSSPKVFFSKGFREKPEIPPNRAQIASDGNSDYVRTLRHLLTNLPYVLLLVSYGVNVGVFYAISTLLNQVISKYLPVSNPIPSECQMNR